MRWYLKHPTQKADDPLWISEFNEKSHPKEKEKDSIRRYKYPAMRKRITYIARKAGIKKPTDFYNLRHSSCFLDKEENLPIDLSSDRHGHGIDFFANVYGRMGVKGKANRLKKHYGMEEEKVKADKNIICARCELVNPPKTEKTEICSRCGFPLSMRKAVEIEKEKETEVEQLRQNVAEMNKKFEIFEKFIKIKGKV